MSGAFLKFQIVWTIWKKLEKNHLFHKAMLETDFTNYIFTSMYENDLIEFRFRTCLQKSRSKLLLKFYFAKNEKENITTTAAIF